jgi:predicted negative regulator of RcsB-dependent stress response
MKDKINFKEIILMSKVKKYLNENKTELVVCGVIGALAGFGFYKGYTAGVKRGINIAAKISGAMVVTYDKVKGTNLDMEIPNIVKENREIYEMILKR